MQSGSFIYSPSLTLWIFFLSLPWLQFFLFNFSAFFSLLELPPLPLTLLPGGRVHRSLGLAWQGLLQGRWIAPGDKQESGLEQATFWSGREIKTVVTEPPALAEDHSRGSASKRPLGEAKQGRKAVWAQPHRSLQVQGPWETGVEIRGAQGSQPEGCLEVFIHFICEVV